MLCDCCGNRPAQAHIELCDWCESDYLKMAAFEEEERALREIGEELERDEPVHPLEDVDCRLDEEEEKSQHKCKGRHPDSATCKYCGDSLV